LAGGDAERERGPGGGPGLRRRGPGGGVGVAAAPRRRGARAGGGGGRDARPGAGGRPPAAVWPVGAGAGVATAAGGRDGCVRVPARRWAMSGAAGGSVVSVGGLLPRDLLDRVAAGDSSLPGMDPTDYGLAPGERLSDAVTRSWNRLRGLWVAFREALDGLPDSEQTATALTRDRWLRPLFDELGFAGLPVARNVSVDGKPYPISHLWADSVPVHLLGARVPIDRVSRGVAGAARTSPHGLVQE